MIVPAPRPWDVLVTSPNGGALAQGSAPRGHVPFDLVVLCAREYQPHRVGNAELLHAPFDDTPRPTRHDIEQAVCASEQVLRALRHERRVLSSCQMGLNRSGLVSGLVLLELGISLRDILSLLRKKRSPDALCNPAFVRVLADKEESLRKKVKGRELLPTGKEAR